MRKKTLIKYCNIIKQIIIIIYNIYNTIINYKNIKFDNKFLLVYYITIYTYLILISRLNILILNNTEIIHIFKSSKKGKLNNST